MLARIRQFGRASAVLALSAFMSWLIAMPGAFAAPVFLPGYITSDGALAIQPQWRHLLSSSALQPDQATHLWRDLHDAALDKHPMRQLDLVNRYFNRIRYGNDSAIYGTRDYWASPAEFIARDFGDCEDYSIAKYVALRALGWSVEELFIVVIRDLKHSVDHAALAAKFDDQWYLLDNRAPRVLTPADVPFYQPIYALNESELLVYERAWPTREALLRAKRDNAGNSNAG